MTFINRLDGRLPGARLQLTLIHHQALWTLVHCVWVGGGYVKASFVSVSASMRETEGRENTCNCFCEVSERWGKKG